MLICEAACAGNSSVPVSKSPLLTSVEAVLHKGVNPASAGADNAINTPRTTNLFSRILRKTDILTFPPFMNATFEQRLSQWKPA